MSLDEPIPDLPDAAALARIIDGDTGEVMLSPVAEVRQATEIIAQQGALVSQVAIEARGYNVARATPEARAALVDFYLVLRELADQLDARAKAIEFGWQRGMTELGATRLPLPDGRAVELTPPATTYQVDPELASDLQAFVQEGLVSAEDAAAAVTILVTPKYDHRVINKLERSAPAEVRESIASHRRVVPPAVPTGKVRFPKPVPAR